MIIIDVIARWLVPDKGDDVIVGTAVPGSEIRDYR